MESDELNAELAKTMLRDLSIYLSLLFGILGCVAAIYTLSENRIDVGILTALVIAFILRGTILRSLSMYYPYKAKYRFSLGAIWGGIAGVGFGIILTLHKQFASYNILESLITIGLSAYILGVVLGIVVMFFEPRTHEGKYNKAN